MIKKQIIKLFILIFFIQIIGCKKSKSNIDYILGSEIEKNIKFQMESLNNNYNNDNFLIIFSDFLTENNKNYLLFSYCDLCEYSNLIQNTNRYALINNIKIPIIFETDIFFSKKQEGKLSKENLYMVQIYFNKRKEDVEVSIIE